MTEVVSPAVSSESEPRSTVAQSPYKRKFKEQNFLLINNTVALKPFKHGPLARKPGLESALAVHKFNSMSLQQELKRRRDKSKKKPKLNKHLRVDSNWRLVPDDTKSLSSNDADHEM